MTKKPRPPPLLQRSRGERLRALPRSLLWTAGVFIITLPVGTLGLVVATCLPYRYRYWYFVRSWSYSILWWTRVVCGIRYQVEGEENIPKSPCIVMCKHQSAWETMATQYWFNPQTWVLKKELLRMPLIGWALSLLSPIAIDRNEGKAAMQQLLEQGRERIREGRWVIIFPEGTRIPAGRCGKYRRGGAVLSWETGTPVVPVAHNAGELWPRNSFLKYPGVIRVRIGPPMMPDDSTPGAYLSRIRAWIETNTREISQVYE